MFPGAMNPKQMKQIMRQMGMNMEQIEAEEVIIRCSDKELVVANPQVNRIKAMGQDSFQVTGEVTERELSEELEVSDEDIKMVAEQAEVSEKEAKKALEDAKGDIAEAIMKIKG